MKYKITEREIKAIANGEAYIKDLFPDVFEIKLEVGKVYKNIKTLFKCTRVIGGELYGYGFGASGNFYNDNESWGDEFLKEATKKEWEEALIKEAERKFKKGDHIKELFGMNFGSDKKGYERKQISDEPIKYNSDEDFLFIGNLMIYRKGIWAEVIKN